MFIRSAMHRCSVIANMGRQTHGRFLNCASLKWETSPKADQSRRFVVSHCKTRNLTAVDSSGNKIISRMFCPEPFSTVSLTFPNLCLTVKWYNTRTKPNINQIAVELGLDALYPLLHRTFKKPFLAQASSGCPTLKEADPYP